jgi:hypothetical protein
MTVHDRALEAASAHPPPHAPVPGARWLQAAFGSKPGRMLTFLLACVAVNVASSVLGSSINHLLYLDMLGTAVAALTVGPWWAASVGLSTNWILQYAPGHSDWFDYTIVNVLGGLTWGWCSRTRLLAPFRPGTTSRALFGRLLGLIMIGGFVCSTAATYVRFDFKGRIVQQQLDALRSSSRQAPENRVFVAAGTYLHPGDLSLDFLPLDLYCMIPDKIISVAFAAFVTFYFFPWFIPARASAAPVLSQRLSAGVFLVAYALPLAEVCLRSPTNTWKEATWSLPVLYALRVLLRGWRPDPNVVLAGRVTREIEPVAVYDVYKDLLGLVVAWYTSLLALEIPYSSPSLKQLVTDGFVIIAVLGYLPLRLMRYYVPRPAPAASSDQEEA